MSTKRDRAFTMGILKGLREANVCLDKAFVAGMTAKAKASKVEQAKAAIAARRALKRRAEQDRKASYTLAEQRAQADAQLPPMPKFWTAFGAAYPTGPRTWRDEAEFLQALATLCRLYGVVISGCGCCGSPSLDTLEPGRVLVGYTNDGQLEPVTAKQPDVQAYAAAPLVPGARTRMTPIADDLEGLGIGLRSLKRDY